MHTPGTIPSKRAQKGSRRRAAYHIPALSPPIRAPWIDRPPCCTCTIWPGAAAKSPQLVSTYTSRAPITPPRIASRAMLKSVSSSTPARTPRRMKQRMPRAMETAMKKPYQRMPKRLPRWIR